MVLSHAARQAADIFAADLHFRGLLVVEMGTKTMARKIDAKNGRRLQQNAGRRFCHWHGDVQKSRNRPNRQSAIHRFVDV